MAEEQKVLAWRVEFEDGSVELWPAEDIKGEPAFGRWVTPLVAGGPAVDLAPNKTANCPRKPTMAHKFTKVLFAVEHDGKAYGVHLPAEKLEQLLAEAARLSPSGSLEMYPMPNQGVFTLAVQKGVGQYTTCSGRRKET